MVGLELLSADLWPLELCVWHCLGQPLFSPRDTHLTSRVTNRSPGLLLVSFTIEQKENC